MRVRNARSGFAAQSKAEISKNTKTEYGIQVMAEGSVSDESYPTACRIETIAFRGNGYTVDDWLESEVAEEPSAFPTYERYLDYAREREGMRTEWTDRILRLLGWSDGMIFHNFAEIFTAVRFTEAKEAVQDNSYTITEQGK